MFATERRTGRLLQFGHGHQPIVKLGRRRGQVTTTGEITDASERSSIDRDPVPVTELQIRLNELRAERLLVASKGVPADSAYMAALDHEIADVGAAYVEAVVTETAMLRAALFGPQVG